MDTNDNTPNLTTPGPFLVQENVTTGLLLTLVASDADLPINGYGLVTYSLDQDFAGLFSLNTTTVSCKICALTYWCCFLGGTSTHKYFG